mgnify:FL=1
MCNFRVFVISTAVLSGCTTPIVRDTSLIDKQTEMCETVDCVIELMDTLPQGPDSERYPFQQGYPDTRLAELKSAGKLDVDTMNPLLLLAGFYGWGYIEPYAMGGVESCIVRYVPGFNWMSLKHELSHCQGYADHGIPIEIATYTPEQQEIMDREHVSKWTDTKYYRGMTQ